MSGVRRQLVDFVDQTKIYNHLKSVTELVQSGSSGVFYSEYKPGWDDAKVGTHFGFSRLQIRDFRRKHIGTENPGGRGKPHNRMAMLKKIGELEDRILALEKYATTEIEVRSQGNGQ